MHGSHRGKEGNGIGKIGTEVTKFCCVKQNFIHFEILRKAKTNQKEKLILTNLIDLDDFYYYWRLIWDGMGQNLFLTAKQKSYREGKRERERKREEDEESERASERADE